MAKLLIEKSNGDIISTYSDDIRIYSESEFLSLAQFENLDWAYKSGDSQKIYDCKLELAKAICTQEQYLILTGRFDLVNIAGTLDKLQNDMVATRPIQKQVWVDPSDGSIKELVKMPDRELKYEAGIIKHNFGTFENSTVVSEKI